MGPPYSSTHVHLTLLCLSAVVNVTFGQAEYTFSEGDGQGTVTVQIDREIAKTLQVNVFGSESAITLSHHHYM